ncbi:uncharacterized protein LOC112589683 [Harpegnathos saltator]|uniref:uncharacterized protein LOC112589683 n=1 Tax=Harpegnathos saltator TaxID=610380 RepID=UPI000DBEE448|nr:uncharacterized protein LOC112589683 [Harpegnathos saltator]
MGPRSTKCGQVHGYCHCGHLAHRARAKEDYLAARVVLKKAIRKAKREAWEQLVSSLGDDPWGRPYKKTIGKIRRWAPPQTETMDPQALDGLLNALFPRAEGGPPVIPPLEMGEGDWGEGLEVTLEELAKARRRLGGKGKAPGPDAIPGHAWALALAEGDLSTATCRVMTGCLREGHMSSSGLDLHDRQYGFRPGRSTLDAIQDLAFTKEGGVQGWCTMERGVPQGSVLGPLLWDIGFDRVLRTPLSDGCHVVCCADDTLVVVEAESWGEARFRAEVAVASVVGTIGDLGLKVAPLKTEAVFFTMAVEWRRQRPGSRQLAPRVREAGLAVARLMRAQGGPGWQAHRLYVGAVLSIVLYGAPI